MSSNCAAPRPRFTRSQVGLLTLLTLSVFINYIDRGNLSIAAPMLKDELRLSASQLGMLLSSFFWTYACFQLLSGWLVDRFEVNWIIAAGFFLWSSATAATGAVRGFAALLAARLVLGIGESVAYPSYSKILARNFPEVQRGFANAAITSGLACGPAFGMLAGGMLMSRFGWRPFFIVLGLVSLIWMAPWIRWMPRGLSADASKTRECPSIAEILRQRSAWGTFLGLFCVNYWSYFVLTWMPFYLVRERQFSMDSMAKIGGAAYILIAIFAALAGRLSDLWITGGGTPTLVRKTFSGAGLLCAGIFVLLCAVANPVLSVIMLMMASISWAMPAANLWAITQTLAGPQAAGRWTGLQNFVGNLAGVVAPAVTGLVVDRTGKFFWAFAITAVVCCIGTISWVFVVGPVKEVAWRRTPRELLSASPA
jgi:MFS family permease